MNDRLPKLGKQIFPTERTVIQFRPTSGPPTEVMELDHYWCPQAGHILFINGHGMQVVNTATFFHVHHGSSSKEAVIDVVTRPEL